MNRDEKRMNFNEAVDKAAPLIQEFERIVREKDIAATPKASDAWQEFLRDTGSTRGELYAFIMEDALGGGTSDEVLELLLEERFVALAKRWRRGVEIVNEGRDEKVTFPFHREEGGMKLIAELKKVQEARKAPEGTSLADRLRARARTEIDDILFWIRGWTEKLGEWDRNKRTEFRNRQRANSAREAEGRTSKKNEGSPDKTTELRARAVNLAEQLAKAKTAAAQAAQGETEEAEAALALARSDVRRLTTELGEVRQQITALETPPPTDPRVELRGRANNLETQLQSAKTAAAEAAQGDTDEAEAALASARFDVRRLTTELGEVRKQLTALEATANEVAADSEVKEAQAQVTANPGTTLGDVLTKLGDISIKDRAAIEAFVASGEGENPARRSAGKRTREFLEGSLTTEEFLEKARLLVKSEPATV